MKYKISNALHDEVFIIREHSMLIDIASLIDAINQKEIMFDTVEMKSDFLATFIKSDIYNKKALQKMTDKRRDEPIIITNFGNKNRIIDGNHRLIKRINDGYKTCFVITVSPSILELFSEPLGY
jgi:hypothetical protein